MEFHCDWARRRLAANLRHFLLFAFLSSHSITDDSGRLLDVKVITTGASKKVPFINQSRIAVIAMMLRMTLKTFLTFYIYTSNILLNRRSFDQPARFFRPHQHGTNTTLTMSFPTPILTGTIAFIVLAVVCVGGVFAGLASGTVSKDNAA